MGKKSSKNQQRAAAKKKRRANRLKKRPPTTTSSAGSPGDLFFTNDDLRNMSDEELDELELALPYWASGGSTERISHPMWDYGKPEYLQVFRESIPDITEEEMLGAMFIEHVWVRELNGFPLLMPAYEVFGMDEHATGPQLLAEAKRWHDAGHLGWHITDHIHISPTVNPEGPFDMDEIDLDELRKFIV